MKNTNPLSVRVASLVMIGFLLNHLFFPTVAFGLTSGPSQPEFSSFSPAGVNNLVDPFTGDFSYNIDLMAVPGFEGGYPINLSYNAGASMEQEASWVGLGWSLNPGAINRNLRGLPDDFKGDPVIKRKSMRPNRTLTYTTSLTPSEVLGYPLDKVVNGRLSLYHNNYNGPGYSIGAGLSLLNYKFAKGRFQTRASLSFEVDSQTGFRAYPGVSVSYRSKKAEEQNKPIESDGNKNTCDEGKKQEEAQPDNNTTEQTSGTNQGGTASGGKVTKEVDQYESFASYSFSKSAPTPKVDFPMSGKSFSFIKKTLTSTSGTTQDIIKSFNYSSNGVDGNALTLGGYGYLHTEEARSNSLMDFNREKDVAVTEHSDVIPIPVATYDVFNVKAQGLGGMVRAYRSDFGIYADPLIKSESIHLGGGPELNLEAGGGVKKGINIEGNRTVSSSGSWSDAAAIKNKFVFEGRKSVNQTKANDFYEPYYFKAGGELTADYDINPAGTNVDSDIPLRVEIKNELSSSIASPAVMGELSSVSGNSNISNYLNKRTKRTKRITEYQFIENKYLSASLPSHQKEHHIGKVIAIQPGGKKYEFGKVLYNMEKKDVSFSVEHALLGTEDGKVSVGANDNTIRNNRGKFENYNATELPPYVHSFLLTEVKSSNYVDLDENGLSENDLGEYVKVSYSTPSPYQWRTPYSKANYAPGSLSFSGDDHGSYSIGKKDVAYVQKLETKTHLVEFHISDREDALPSAPESQRNGGKPVSITSSIKKKKLDRISLWKKGKNYSTNPNDKKEIKSAYFEYTYDLCKGIENNSGQAVSDLYNGSTNKGGKLTLKKVYFTYGGNKKSSARLSPYVFNYGESDVAKNPNYSPKKMDRWGNYNPKRFDGLNADATGVNSSDYSFTYQGYTDEERNNIAGAWSIRSITLPSGGVMKVDYEMDDYTYVESQKASQMVKVVGIGTGAALTTSGLLKGSPERNFLHFKAPKGISSVNDLKKCFDGVDQLYFKVFIHLKTNLSIGALYPSTNPAVINGGSYDYVEGYAKIDRGDPNNFCGINNSGEYGWVKIDYVNLNDHKVGGLETHPFRKAGFNHIRYNRKDLTNSIPGSSGTHSDFLAGVDNYLSLANKGIQLFPIVKSIGKFLFGFNTIASISYCKDLELSGAKSNLFPSYIRIKVPEFKYGGGHRVKRITISDEWKNMNNRSGVSNGYEKFEYGQEFIYRNGDGKSTGVACYEPIVGGEENTLKKPLYYGPKELFFSRDDAFYVETPVGESFYPGANVGYSEVIIKSIAHDGVTKGGSGIVVKEFHTAKDFPVLVKRTGLKEKKFNPPPIVIPFIGTKTFSNYGYSQGFSVELNDMHGKPKSEKTFGSVRINEADEHSSIANERDRFLSDIQYFDAEPPVAGVDYVYNVEGKYLPGTRNELSNAVKVLDGNDIKERELGKSVEFYLSTRENKTVSRSTSDFNPNGVSTPWLVLIMLAKYLSHSEGVYREVSTTKVISRNAILLKKIVYDGLAKTETENLVFDPDNGDVVLSTVNNNFNDKVYTYNIPAKNHYKAFKSIHENVGAEYNIATTTDFPWVEGDVIVKADQTSGVPTRYWVKEINGSSVVLVDKDGTVVTGLSGTFKVLHSGYKNLTGVKSGTIVSLKNPIAKPLPFDISNYNGSRDDFNVVGCDGETVRMTPFVLGATLTFTSKDLPGCSMKLVFPPGTNLTGKTISMTNNIPSVTTPTGTETGKVVIGDDCPICIDVLNASATTFSDHIPAPSGGEVIKTQIGVTAYNTFDAKRQGNPYKYGKKGIYKPETQYFYRKGRKRELPGATKKETNIRKNGIYDVFSTFNYNSGATNKNWIEKSKVTLFSPYGYGLESKDALDIYSSALYGYGNKLPVMVAANGKYGEIAFEHFEDYNTSTFPDGTTTLPHGHIYLKDSKIGVAITNEKSHTGDYSLKINAGSKAKVDLSKGLNSQVDGNKYFVSLWVYTGIINQSNKTLIEYKAIVNGNTVYKKVDYDVEKTNIDGWQQIQFSYIKESGLTDQDIIIGHGTEDVYVDDIRIIPYDGSAQTYVYDDQLRVSAILDEQHYATFYHYDEEGNLLQVKKETEKGIMTLKSGRIHTQKQ